jgi:hypothetical protein
MSVRTLRRSLLVVALVSSSFTLLGAQKPPALPDLLKTAADSLVQYAQQLGTVAADEEFTQYETSSGKMSTPKRINSVVVLIGQADGSIGSFRDLVAIDTVPVRPKDDRLVALFKKPTPESAGSAQAMTDDAVKAYYSPNLHVLDKPTLALDLLRAENQANFTYKIEGMKNMDGTQVAVLKFSEKGAGHVMTGASAIGRYWIEPANGAIHQTELGFSIKGGNLTSTVKFVKDAQLGVFVPSELDEQVEVSAAGAGTNNMGAAAGSGDLGGRQSMEGRASYSKYRRTM